MVELLADVAGQNLWLNPISAQWKNQQAWCSLAPLLTSYHSSNHLTSVVLSGQKKKNNLRNIIGDKGCKQLLKISQ